MNFYTEQLIFAGIVILSVIIGFLMGFKAARPEEKLIKTEKDMGPTEDPGQDIWTDAMTPPKEPIDAEERLETMKR